MNHLDFWPFTNRVNRSSGWTIISNPGCSYLEFEWGGLRIPVGRNEVETFVKDLFYATQMIMPFAPDETPIEKAAKRVAAARQNLELAREFKRTAAILGSHHDTLVRAGAEALQVAAREHQNAREALLAMAENHR